MNLPPPKPTDVHIAKLEDDDLWMIVKGAQSYGIYSSFKAAATNFKWWFL